MRLLPGALVPGTRYRLRNWLGDGGMGVVYEAEHIDLERAVALKILRAPLADRDDERERFRQEARLTTRIVSPHVVNVLDFGVLRDGRVFYAMELLQGRPLSVEIGRGPMAPARAIGLLRQMCAGLAAAHASGVIHRDVKPDNAMICESSGRAYLKLLDFGIASPASDATTKRASGTPEYMAPEQIRGEAFDVRLDVYALGCTAYEMLTGSPPFCYDTSAEVVAAQIDEIPLPPTRKVEGLQIPPQLEQVVMRCIAKDPDDRWASMAELEAALCEAQIAAGLRTDWDDLPLPDIAPDRRARLEARMPRPAKARPSKRRWVAFASLGLAACAGLVWLPSSDVGAADHERVEQLAVSARAAATRGAYVYPLPDDPTESAYATLVTLESIEGPAASLADETAGRLRRALADELVALGDGYWDDLDARPYARDYYAQAVLFDPQSSYARERAAFTPGELSDLRVRAETQDFTEPELEAAEPLAALAVVDEEQRAEVLSEVTADPPTSPVASRRRAKPRPSPTPTVERVPEPARVSVMVPVVTDLPLELDASKPSALQKVGARSLARKGQRAFSHGQREAAETAFRRALELDPRNAAAMRGLSDVHFDRGEHERALHYAKRSTQVEPGSGSGFIRLGDAWFKLLDYPAARRAYRRAQELGRRDAAERLRRLDRVSKP